MSGTNFVPVVAFFLIGGLESFHFPRGAVLFWRADKRRNLPSDPGLQGHAKVLRSVRECKSSNQASKEGQKR